MILGFGKKRITSEDLSQGLWMFCKKFSKGFYEQFRPQIDNMGFHLSKEQEAELSREIIMINLWIISKSLVKDQKALEALHKIFIFGHRNMAESEQEKKEMAQLAQEDLQNRYKAYYGKWQDGSGDQTLLSVRMLEYMITKGEGDRRLINALSTFSLNTHILSMMKSVLDFRKAFEISD